MPYRVWIWMMNIFNVYKQIIYIFYLNLFTGTVVLSYHTYGKKCSKTFVPLLLNSVNSNYGTV